MKKKKNIETALDEIAQGTSEGAAQETAGEADAIASFFKETEQTVDGADEALLFEGAEEVPLLEDAEADAKPKRAKRAKRVKEEKPPAKRKRNAIIAVSIVSAVVIAAGIFVGLNLSNMLNPDITFDTPTIAPIVEAEDDATPNPNTPAPGEPTPEPTIDPVAILDAQGDATIKNKDIVNIMLIGVDYEPARAENWYGKSGNSFHSDVMIVIAANFKEGRADLISFPRDTYVEIPGIKGIYKMNASLNCGKNESGEYGFDPKLKNEGPFLKVCETAKWMLGDEMPVDYYYAVTMTAMKQVVDVVGPIWYNLEEDFDNGKRYYKAGEQWMDGQAVLDYVRVRKDGHGGMAAGDQNRADRQRKMLVAILDHMKTGGTLVKLPELLKAFEGELFTNTTLAQTATLAGFAYGLSGDKIGMHAMKGATRTIFHWNFCLTDQKHRVDVIKQVYGIDVETMPRFSASGAQGRWAGMLDGIYLSNARKVLNHAAALIAEDDKLALNTPTPSPAVTPTPSPTRTPSPPPTPTPGGGDPITPPPEVTPEPPPPTEETGDADLPSRRALAPATTRQYSDAQRAMVNDLRALINSVSKGASMTNLQSLQQKAIAVAKEFRYSGSGIQTPCQPGQTYVAGSAWGYQYYTNKNFNEVIVNFN